MECYSDRGLLNEKEYINLKHLAGKVNRFFCQFLELLETPTESYSCCTNPEIITLDGIVLSIDSGRIRRQHLKSPWINGESNERFLIEYLFKTLERRPAKLDQ